MAKTPPAPANPDIKYYLEPVPLSSIHALNTGLTSASEKFMRGKLGDPVLPLIHTDCRNQNASAQIKPLLKTVNINPRLQIEGIQPAVDSVVAILAKAFQQERQIPGNHDLEAVLRSPGMLCVRLRNVTTNPNSTAISNHSWGTAIDFNIVGNAPPGNTGDHVPRCIAVLIPFFNAAGWYAGAGFKNAMDSMHFEVSEEELIKWFPQNVAAPAGVTA